MHFTVKKFNNGKISTIRVFEDDEDNSILINQRFIKTLRSNDLLSDTNINPQIVSIVARAIELKENNKKATCESGAKYKLGNDVTFINKFVEQLAFTLKTTCIERVVAFFEEAKVQDLNDFINHPSYIHF